LAPYHEPPVHVDLLAPRFLGPAIGDLLVTAAVVALRRRWPAGLAAWVGYALLFAPVSGLVHAGSHLVADRYSYLPTAAFALLLGGAATVALGARHTTPARRRAAAILLCGIVVVLVAWAAAAWRHSASWRDTLTVWQVSVAADPQCRLCALNLAGEYFNVGQFSHAEVWARRAIERWPGRGTPHHRLGAALLAQGRNAEAETELREAIRLAPGLAEAHRELGRLHMRQGRFSEATGELREALALGAPATEVEGLLRSFPSPATKE
jgi:tetratricopeptide (TPR) repeat protein